MKLTIILFALLVGCTKQIDPQCEYRCIKGYYVQDCDLELQIYQRIEEVSEETLRAMQDAVPKDKLKKCNCE